MTIIQRNCIPCCIVFLLLVSCSQSIRIRDPNHYVSWYQGNGRIVISAPHGGYQKPGNIRNRTKYGCIQKSTNACYWDADCQPKDTKKCRAVLTQDVKTQEISVVLYETLKKLQLSPDLIISHLHRSKLDPNRPINEAAQGDPRAEEAYNSFHGFIQKARARIAKTSTPGLYLDMHGQSHRENWTEIGYRITTDQLIKGDYQANESSILALSSRSSLSIKDLITGNTSFGGYLERAGDGYKVVPSELIPYPNPGGYYRGGYNTLEYGSLKGGCIDGIQVEVTGAIRKQPSAIYDKFARDLAEAVRDFMKEHNYFGEDKKLCPSESSNYACSNTSNWLLQFFCCYLSWKLFCSVS